MGKRKIARATPPRAQPRIVGTIHTRGGFAAAAEIGPAGIDFAEVRLDQLPAFPSVRIWEALPVPAIATARDPAEGGDRGLASQQRRELLERALPHAAAIDVELANARRFAALLSAARAHGTTVILSSHHFHRVPSQARIQDSLARARDAGADLFKIATVLHRPMDVLRLVELLDHAAGFPVAAMGMGPLGRASRLFLSACGSQLLYGWLHRPQVPGQYPAQDLREKLAETLPPQP